MKRFMAFPDIAERLSHVTDSILAAFEAAGRSDNLPRLVAVSKIKPAEAIIEAYESGHRYFGENYVQELEMKANLPEIQEKCPNIRWHFIGNLQSNKVRKLAKIPNLWMVETIDSEKLASTFNSAVSDLKSSGNPADVSDTTSTNLKVFVQVNTSGETQKNGISPDHSLDLAGFITDSCPSLEFCGFMTIGALLRSRPQPSNSEENSDFSVLRQIRSEYCAKNKGILPEKVELSMGMSADFEEAVRMGSTNVRIGSSIFGQRERKSSK